MTSATTETPPRAGKPQKPYTRERNNREEVPGYALLHAILDEKARRGQNSYAPIIEGLELSQSSWNNIINGCRDMRSLANHPGRRRWIATYLDIPPIAVRVLAGETPISDFELDFSLDDRLRLTAEELRKDPMWAVYAPQDIENEWDPLPLKIRILIKALYDAEKERLYQWALKNTAGAKKGSKATRKATDEPVKQAVEKEASEATEPLIDDL